MSQQASLPSDLAVLDALTDHICILDASGLIVAVNRAWRDFAAANPPLAQQADVGANYFAVCAAVSGEDAGLAREALRGLRAVSQGELPEFVLEYPCHSPDTQRWFQMRATRLAGEVPGKVVVTHTNVTQRKLAEESLRESEGKFAAAFHASPDLMALTRLADGTIVEVNEAYSNMLGFSREESLGKTTGDLAIWADAQDRATFAAALRAFGKLTDFETRLRRKDRSLITVSDSARTLTIGGEAFILSVARDITERKRAEAALRESEERYRSLVASSLDAVLLTAPDGRIFAANEAACTLFGCSEETLVALGRDGVVDPSDPRLEPALRERARTGRVRAELTFIRPDGSRFEGEVSSSVFRTSDDEARTSMVIRDITERK